MIHIEEKICFDEFKARLRARLDGAVSFREEGKHGWTSVEDIMERRPGGRPGPHWCDASFVPSTRWLAGSYNFNTGFAKFFIKGV